ncbi:protein GVQW3-like [Lycorma delicatula]|uniref:protein GVQW3-like n=1 Tax=Lycorma delicatula TaxID=130591 RepID=UPI003F516758
MIQTVYGSEEMSPKNVLKWYARFRDGIESIEDDRRPGASSTVQVEENIQKVAEILPNDRCASIRLIEEITGIPKTTVHRILTENLGKKKIRCRFVPHSLADDQKDCRMEHCKNMKKSAARDPDFMSCIVTVQRTFRRNSNRDSPSNNNIRLWNNQPGTTGCLCKGKIEEVKENW